MRCAIMCVLAAGLFCVSSTAIQADNPVLSDTLANLRIDGEVYAVARQDDGKVIIGGGFDRVNDADRLYIARLNTDGTVDTDWNPNADGLVTTLAVDGSAIYVGGSFTNIGGQARNCIARLNDIDGSADSWDPDADDMVYEIMPDNGSIYVCGIFTNIGGQARNYIARLNDVDGSADSWDPNASDNIEALAIDEIGIYAGGSFTNIGGQARNYIARLDPATGNADAWNPDAADGVYVLIRDGSDIYAGGSFTNIGGQARNCIARLDTTTGNADSWNPDASDTIEALAIDDSGVYAGGSFTNIGGQARNCIARLDPATGSADSWNPNAMGPVYALAIDDSGVYAGGAFSLIGEDRASAFCKLAKTDAGIIPDWNVACKVIGGAIALDVAVQPDGKVVIAGLFTWINDVSRKYIARLNTDGTVDTEWDPNPDDLGLVRCVACDDSYIYVGGSFTNIGGEPRNFIARLNNTDGSAEPWIANANNTVRVITVAGDDLYAGGRFTTIGGQARNYIARLRKEDGGVDPWIVNADDEIYDIAADDVGVYMAGMFTAINGVPRNYIARVSAASGHADAWDANANNWVNSLEIDGTDIYATGGFTNIGGQARNYIARLSQTDGAADTWDPNPDDLVYAAAVEGSNVYVGGLFDTIGGKSRKCLARLRKTDAVADTWTPDGNAEIYALAVDSTNCYAVGYFTILSGQPRLGFARFYLQSGPGKPEGVSASDGAYTDRIEVTWNASDRAETYQVWRHTSDDTNSAVELASGVTGTSFSDTNCVPSEIYYYWIKAVNPAGSSTWSASDSGYCRSSGIAVYRFYSAGDPASTYTHLWTINETERDVLIASPAWQYEGIGWHALTNMDLGAVPLYRLYEPNIRRHLYTVNPAEYVALTNTSWNGEGVQYFVYATNSISGLVPAYRFYNSGNQNHHFTVDENEKNTIIAMPEWGYTYEGIGFYVAVTNMPVPVKQSFNSLLAQKNPANATMTRLSETRKNPVKSAVERATLRSSGKTVASTEKTVYYERTGHWYVVNTDQDTISKFYPDSVTSFDEQYESELSVVPGDYNGDELKDIALYEESTGLWWILPDGREVEISHLPEDTDQFTDKGGTVTPITQWGGPGFTPVSGDYDGNGVNDLAVYHNNTGRWYIITLEGEILVWDGR